MEKQEKFVKINLKSGTAFIYHVSVKIMKNSMELSNSTAWPFRLIHEIVSNP